MSFLIARLVLQCSWASLAAQLVKNPPAMRETWIWSLGWEDPLEKGKATHYSILTWRIPWMNPLGCKESCTTECLSLQYLTALAGIVILKHKLKEKNLPYRLIRSLWTSCFMLNFFLFICFLLSITRKSEAWLQTSVWCWYHSLGLLSTNFLQE